MLAKDEVLQNRYKITRQLGQGGMGAVYEAVDNKRFGKPIALKEILIDAGEAANPSRRRFLKRAFESEAKILASLEHECFPQVIDYFVEQEQQFLVMELVQGENLSDLLENRQTAFSTDEVLNWARQLLDALDYLHTLPRPVFHRDIKPQNLKLTKRGRVKLLDFGIAKASDFRVGLTLTNQTFIAATLYYSPLEQIVKAVDANYREFLMQKFGEKFIDVFDRKTDARSDIYALGATIYHLLTNTLPVDSLKRALKVFVGENDPLPNPQALNPLISAAISDWLLRALELESENRFASANEMMRSLAEVLDAEKVRCERESLREEYLRLAAEMQNLTTFREKSSGEERQTDELFFDDLEIEKFLERTFDADSTEIILFDMPTDSSAGGGDVFASENSKKSPEIEAEEAPTAKARLSLIAAFGAIIVLTLAAFTAILAANFFDNRSENPEAGTVVVFTPEAAPPTVENVEKPVQQTDITQTEVKPPETTVIKKTKPTPIPAPTPKKNQPKKQNKPQTVTVDDLINDN